MSGLTAQVELLAPRLNARKGFVDLRDWDGLDLTGANDMASIFNAAMVQAAAANMPVTGPAGRYLIGSTITQLAPLIGPAWGRSLTMPHLWLDSAISDGTPVIKRVEATAIEGLYLRNLSIRSGQSNPASAENAVGIMWGDPSDTTPTGQRCTRSRMENVWVSGFATGVRLKGWYNDLDLFIVACQTGFVGRTLNAVVAKITFENNQKDYAIENSDTLTFLKLTQEGPYRTAASTIDGGTDCLILNWRTEADPVTQTVPWLSVGPVEQVRNLRIVGGNVQAPAIGTPALSYDKYIGPRPDIRTRGGSNRRSYTYTADTTFTDVRAPDTDFAFPFSPNNYDATQQPALNFLPNPTMDGLRWGCSNAVVANTGGVVPVLSSETSIVRTGASALRIDASTGGTFQRLELRFNDPWVTSLQSKRVTFGGWIYIPDVESMDGSAGASPTHPVCVGIRQWNGAADTEVAVSVATYQRRNGWNFITVSGVIAADTTELRLRVWLANSATTTVAGTHFIVVDSLYLCPGDCWRDIYEGRVVQSPLASGGVRGGRLEMRMTSSAATTLIADTTQTFQQGDTIIYTDAAAGSAPGIYCTTGGAGGTAVFKAMANLAA